MSAVQRLDPDWAVGTTLDWRELDGSSRRQTSILLLAHDHNKAKLVDLAICYRDILVKHMVIATPTTARLVTEMAGLTPVTLSSGLDGNDVEIVDCLGRVRMAAVIFLVDPFSRRVHEPRLEPVIEVCARYDIPLATNIATASAVLNLVSVLDAAESLPVGTLQDK